MLHLINWLQRSVGAMQWAKLNRYLKKIKKLWLVLCPSISITCRRFKGRRFDAFFKPKGLPVKENIFLLVGSLNYKSVLQLIHPSTGIIAKHLEEGKLACLNLYLIQHCIFCNVGEFIVIQTQRDLTEQKENRIATKHCTCNLLPVNVFTQRWIWRIS